MRTGHVAAFSLSLVILLSLAGPAKAQNQSVADHWEELIHYIQIAKPELALAHGQWLVNEAPEAELLDAVEASRVAESYEVILERAQNVETTRDMAIKLVKKIQDARFKRARDPERIRQDIQKLAQGERARKNALERLRVAGQFASKELLKTLQNPDESKMHPYVLGAMVTIGRDMVYPLAEALADLEPVAMGQVAEVLGEIGYPRALPYLKRVMENEKADAHAKATIARAYMQIAKSQGLTEEITAAQLFLVLGRNFYTAATDGKNVIPGIDEVDDTGVIWVYNIDAGLVDIHVPSAIFGDVLSHRAARAALQLQSDLDPALSLWLMANLRRENRLPEGGKDLSYPPTWHSPMFYLKASQPLRSHDVLERALNDGDAELSRDAIKALGDIAGTDALVNKEGTIQPLLRALGYPDRRVRYESSFTLTNARPKAAFPGSFRVVPVLAEAVRQTEIRYALVIASTQDRYNTLASVLKDSGYSPFGGLSLEASSDELTLKPGIDLIVTDLDADGVTALYEKSIADYKLAAVPMVAVGTEGTVIRLSDTFRGNRRMFPVLFSDDAAKLKPGFEQARLSYVGKEVGADEAAKYASQSLMLLREIVMSRDEVYNVLDAQPALLEALSKDSRQAIVQQVGTVLALINTDDSQKALADAALDETRPEDTRISLLSSLAESATHYGSKLNEVQLDNLQKMLGTAKGDLGIAAARAFGAHSQPTAKVVDLITK
mgnify:CR=1 FL=1